MVILGGFQTERTGEVYENDLFVYLRFFICVLIGFQREYYTTIKKAMMILLVFGVAVNFLSLFSSDTFVRSMLEEKSLAYKLQYILLPSFFYLFQLDSLTRKEKIIVLSAVILYFLEQILFQKRLPTFRVITTLIFYFYSIKLLTKGKFGTKLIVRRFLIFSISVFLTVQLFALVGFNISEYGGLLFDRFFNEGTVGETIADDSRWKIGETFYQNLEKTNEYFSGRGIGSVIYDNTFLFEDTSGRSYRSAAEMGLPTMLLKGGIVLIGLFALILIKFIGLFKVCRKDEYLFGAWATVIIWFIFLYSEGFIGNLLSVFEILLGYSIGMVLSAASQNGKRFIPNEKY